MKHLFELFGTAASIVAVFYVLTGVGTIFFVVFESFYTAYLTQFIYHQLMK